MVKSAYGKKAATNIQSLNYLVNLRVLKTIRFTISDFLRYFFG